MKLNSTTLMFKTMILIGLTMSMSASNWIMLWTGLEMMLMSFIPIMNSKKTTYSESMMKYFIMQSISSALLMMSMMMILTKMDSKFIMMTAMLIKLAIAPMNMWFISSLEGINTEMLMTVLITMKITPLMIMSYMNLKLNMIIMYSMVTTTMLIINQTSMKKIIGHSSIFNLTLLLSLVSMSSMWMYYLLIYSMMTMSIINMIKTIKIKFINQLIMSEQSKIMKLNLWILMMSFMGMPPFLGFMNKIMVFEALMNMKELTILMVMIMSSMSIAFTYMRLSYTSMMMMSMKMKWETINKNKMKMLMITMINLITLMQLI
uniref:NADH-ubiquinone oxidoreductase chain 2 n=1 Tax=Olidiana tongmaiensis TaxID=2501809 RepID=A0A898PA56_9HEMI|nr:NADH dehydrogenase subunit 2 [Olidiana tongmaiensis]QSJ61407.1 NADH dehydrogenase subunit 2 [Olidiana tongmaiensis]